MSSPTVAVDPALFSWALERSGVQQDAADRFPHLVEWLTTDRQPTLKQLDDFAAFTRTPIGFFFLDTPPRDVLPIPDFRTLGDRDVGQPSVDLLEVIYDCQLRQQWYIDYAREAGISKVGLVGALTEGSDVVAAADAIRAFIDLPTHGRRGSWAEAFRTMTKKSEDAGFLVMTSGIVGNNTHRRLDPDEFRGFSLVDDVVPLIFVNGADTKAASIFTLAHKLAHLSIGQGGVDGLKLDQLTSPDTERWCNEVAAELLVPRATLRASFDAQSPVPDELDRLARLFRVSTLVVLGQLWSQRLLTMTWAQYQRTWQAEKDRVRGVGDTDASGGGNFYKTLPVRVSRRFATALVSATIDGRTPFREAAQLLGVGRTETFEKLSQELGLVA